jgi:nucleoside-diphosphate-sugar epimerase
MTRVLITGISGFVGSSLARKLVEEGYSVSGLVRPVAGRELASLKPVMDKIQIVRGDLTTYHSVSSALSLIHPQYVLHLGALTPVRLSFEDPFPFIETNFRGTANLVHAMLEKTPKSRLILASTAEVYGLQRKREPIKETALLNPSSPYAVSKEAADQYVRMAMTIYDLKATILRPMNTYGRQAQTGFIVEYLITSMLNGESCFLGAPNSIRDYMFIDDHMNAYLLAMKSERAVGEIFNVSPGNPITNRRLCEIVAEITEFKRRINYGSYPPGYPQRPAQWDPPYLVLDNAKISKILGWRPTVTLEEGLRKTVEMWR